MNRLRGGTKVMCVKNISLGGEIYEQGNLYIISLRNGDVTYGVYVQTPDEYWEAVWEGRRFELETFNEHFKTLEEIRDDKINSLIK